MPLNPCNLKTIHDEIKRLEKEVERRRKDVEEVEKLPKEERKKRKELLRILRTHYKEAVKKLEKAKNEAQKWIRLRREAMVDIGEGPLGSAHLATLNHRERVRHIQGLINNDVAEHVILEQLYQVARLDPDNWPIATRVFADEVKNKKGEKTWKFRRLSDAIGVSSRPGTHLRGATDTIRRMNRVFEEENIGYEKILTDESIDVSDIKRILVDRMTPPADGNVFEVKNDADALFYSNIIALRRRNAPDLVPPMTDQIVTKAGKMPRVIPFGKLGPAGRRIVTNAGEPRAQEPVTIGEHIGASYLHRWLIRGKETWNAYAREFRNALKAAGIDVPDEWVPKFHRLMQRAWVLKEKANAKVDHYKRMLVSAMARYGISAKDLGQMSRLVRAMRWIDNAQELVRRRAFREARKSGKSFNDAREAALKASEQVYEQHMRKAQEEFGLSDDELGFIRWTHDSFFSTLYAELGMDPREYRVGYFPRVVRSLESFYEAGRGIETEGETDWLNIDPTLNPWHAAHTRWAEMMTTEGDSLLQQHMQDLVASEVLDLVKFGNPLDILLSYARQGLTRKYVGETIRDLIAEFGVEEGGVAVRFLLGDARVTQDIVQRARRDVLALMALPTKSMAQRNARLRMRLVGKAKKLKSLADRLDSIHAPKPIVEAVRWMFRRYGIAASRYEVRSWLDNFAWNHRYVTFGLNFMAPIRDTVSTFILATAANQMKYVGRAFADTYLRLLRDPEGFKQEYGRQFQRGWVRWFTEDVALEQLSIQAELRGLSADELAKNPREALRMLKELDWRETASIFYKVSDIGTRLLVNRAAELQGRKAFREFRKHGDVDRLVLDADLATLPSETARNLISMAKEGVGEEAWIDQYVMAKQAETAMNYSRYVSAPFIDYAPGKVFFQYGTWSHNFLGTLWHQLAAPWRLASDGVISPMTAFRTQVMMYARWALMAEITYSLGAMVGVDTTDWIPWIHNAVPTGGPMLSNFEMVHEMLTGNADEEVKRLTRDPARRMLLLARKVIPGFPVAPGAPGSFVRAVGMLLERSDIIDPDTLRAAFGMDPDDYRTAWNGFLTIFGFHGLDPHIRPRFQPGGILHGLAGAAITPFQKTAHEVLGLPKPPSEIQKRRH